MHENIKGNEQAQEDINKSYITNIKSEKQIPKNIISIENFEKKKTKPSKITKQKAQATSQLK